MISPAGKTRAVPVMPEDASFNHKLNASLATAHLIVDMVIRKLKTKMALAVRPSEYGRFARC